MKSTFFALFTLLLSVSHAADNLALREALAASKEVDWVFPAGEYITVATKKPSGFFGVTVGEFQQAIVNVCTAGWKLDLIMKNPDPMKEGTVWGPATVFGKDAKDRIFKPDGSSNLQAGFRNLYCLDGFHWTNESFAGPSGVNNLAKRNELAVFESNVRQPMVWVGKPKEWREDKTVPENGVVTGKTLGLDRLMITGIESYAWAAAKCEQRAGRLDFYYGGRSYKSDILAGIRKLRETFFDPYGAVPQRPISSSDYSYSTEPYYLGCDSEKPFVLKVTGLPRMNGFGQEMRFEDGRTLKSVLN